MSSRTRLSYLSELPPSSGCGLVLLYTVQPPTMAIPAPGFTWETIFWGRNACFFLWRSFSIEEIHSQSPQWTSPSCLMGQNFIPCPILKQLLARGKELPLSASTNINPLEASILSLEVCDCLTSEQKQDSISKVEDRNFAYNQFYN